MKDILARWCESESLLVSSTRASTGSVFTPPVWGEGRLVGVEEGVVVVVGAGVDVEGGRVVVVGAGVDVEGGRVVVVGVVVVEGGVEGGVVDGMETTDVVTPATMEVTSAEEVSVEVAWLEAALKEHLNFTNQHVIYVITYFINM